MRLDADEAWSPYDAAVPHVTGLADAQRRFRELRGRRARWHLPADELLGAVRRLVVVVSSSRGGSTAMGELLRRVPRLLHLRAEVNPLFALAGLHDHGRSRVLADELAADVGAPAPGLAAEEVEPFALGVAWRLTAQWPTEPIDPDAVTAWVADALACQRRTGRWQPGGPFDEVELHLAVLEQARAAHPDIHPGYYDLPTEVVAARFGDLPPPAGPPAPALVEMPPFVLVGPWRAPDLATVHDHPLVLTTPRNAFRLGFLAGLFPAAELRVLHLTRNPAASVNGLVDGWLHHGFFNCRIGRRLAIAGYSDRFPWGERWWCYDVPPGWDDVCDAPLAAVCALQWRTAHEAVLDHLRTSEADRHRLRFEDVVGPSGARRRALGGLAAWLGVPADAVVAAAARLPTVMATAPPTPRRWARRADELAPVLADPAVADLACRLGYGTDPSTWP